MMSLKFILAALAASRFLYVREIKIHGDNNACR